MSKFWIYLIGILEIVGGFCGVAFIVWQLVTAPLAPHNIPFAIIIVAIYLLSLAGGVGLLLGRKFGRVLSIIVQAIQLPKYSSQLLIFMFSFGFDAYVYGMLTNTAQVAFGAELKFFAFYQLFPYVADAPVLFGISIPATAFLVMLLRKPKPAASGNVAADDADAPNKSLVRSADSLFLNLFGAAKIGCIRRGPVNSDVRRFCTYDANPKTLGTHSLFCGGRGREHPRVSNRPKIHSRHHKTADHRQDRTSKGQWRILDRQSPGYEDTRRSRCSHCGPTLAVAAIRRPQLLVSFAGLRNKILFARQTGCLRERLLGMR